MAITIGPSTITGVAANGLPSGVINASTVASGTLVGAQSYYYDSTYLSSAGVHQGVSNRFTIINGTYTPKMSNTESSIVVRWITNRAEGPRATNLDPHGHSYGITWNGSTYGVQGSDVHLSPAIVGSYGCEWHAETESGTFMIPTSWSAGTSYSIQFGGWTDGAGQLSVNRSWSSATNTGYTSLLIMEYKK